MANVVVGGTSIALARGGVDHHFEEYGGDAVRMESGALRNTRKGFKSTWTLTTPPITAATLSTYTAAIDAAAPITCSGDALGASFSCVARKIAADRMSFAGVVKYILHFELREI